MSALDKLCVFMKELAYRYKVPAEMHISGDGSVRVHIQREAITAEQSAEILADAARRGLIQQPNNHWISLSG